MDDIPVKQRNNRISRQAKAAWSPLPLRAQLERLLAMFRERAKMARREKPWVRTRIVLPRPRVPRGGHFKPKVPRPGFPGRGHCRPKFSTRASDGLAQSAFDPSSGAGRAASCDFSLKSEEDTRGETWVRTRIVLSRPGVPRGGHYRPKRTEAWGSRTGT